MGTANKLLQAASGGAGDTVYVDDVFGTFLYNGDTSSSSRKLDTGLDFSDKGGMAWFKQRDGSGRYGPVYDTVSNAGLSSNFKYLFTQTSDGYITDGTPPGLVSFNSDGVNVGQNNPTNNNGQKFCLWQFLKQPGFFDIQTYTGDNSSSGRQISHDLGCVPSMIWIKRTDFGDDWIVYHVGNGHTNPEDYYLKLNETTTRTDDANYWNDTAPTATHFTIGGSGQVNQGSATYVAYIFAGTNDSASQIFGAGGDEAIIKSGFFEYSGGTDIDLGFEPQWILYKNASGASTSYWGITDTMRPWRHQPNSVSTYLRANGDNAESDNGVFRLLHNGFRNTGGFGGGDRIIYTAIRKPNKPADYGTDYFGLTAYTGTDTSVHTFEFGPQQFDWHVNTRTDGNSDNKTHMRGFGRASSTSASQLGALKLNATSVDDSADLTLDHSGGCTTTTKGTINGSDQYYQAAWMRRPGLLDIVSYEGNYTARTISHQLDAVPEMMLIKSRTSTRPWLVYHSALGNAATLNITTTNGTDSPSTSWNTTTPTSSVFSLGAQNGVNENGKYFVALLYASSAGIQKIGSFTKSGNTTVDCGFAAHPRWIMLKRYDSTGDWYVFYAFNNGGNDTYYLWNSNQPSVTNQNYIENYAGGFQVEGLDDGNYIFMAIA